MGSMEQLQVGPPRLAGALRRSGPLGAAQLQRVRERIQGRIDAHRERVLGRADLTQAASFLGVTEDDLTTELQNGKTFIEVARDHGKTDDQIRTFLIERATETIDERLQISAGDATAPASA